MYDGSGLQKNILSVSLVFEGYIYLVLLNQIYAFVTIIESFTIIERLAHFDKKN